MSVNISTVAVKENRYEHKYQIRTTWGVSDAYQRHYWEIY